jgi:hypothetical protein
MPALSDSATFHPIPFHSRINFHSNSRKPLLYCMCEIHMQGSGFVISPDLPGWDFFLLSDSSFLLCMTMRTAVPIQPTLRRHQYSTDRCPVNLHPQKQHREKSFRCHNEKSYKFKGYYRFTAKRLRNRVVAISSNLVAEQKEKSQKPLVWRVPRLVDTIRTLFRVLSTS